jgi:hypothetical protein
LFALRIPNGVRERPYLFSAPFPISNPKRHNVSFRDLRRAMHERAVEADGGRGFIFLRVNQLVRFDSASVHRSRVQRRRSSVLSVSASQPGVGMEPAADEPALDLIRDATRQSCCAVA